MKMKILLGLALIVAMLSLSSCSSLVNFLNATDRTLRNFDRLLENSEYRYQKLQSNFGCEQTDRDTTTTKEYSKPTARP